MVTFWLTLGPEGMDQLRAGLSSEAVSQDKPHFLRTGLLIFSFFCWLSQYDPTSLGQYWSLTPAACPAGSQPWRKPWCPWFLHSPHLRHRNLLSPILSICPSSWWPSCSLSPVLTGQSGPPPVSSTFSQSAYSVTTPWCEGKNSHFSLNKHTTSFQCKA